MAQASAKEAQVTLDNVNSHGEKKVDAPASSRLIQLIVDFAERAFLILLAVPFLWAFGRVFAMRPTLILVCFSEMMSVFFIIIRKRAPMRLGTLAVLSAFCGSAFPLLVRPGGAQLVPAIVSSTVMTAGLSLSVASKLYLNRSFGLIAANRGVKSGGPYRVVRHPMYLGYIVTEFGFLIGNLTVANLVIYLATWTFQIVRIREEEQVLRRDDAYRELATRVPSRLIPGIY